MSYFDGKKVFISGGSAGIGRAAALQLAREGASVVVSARRQGPLDQTVAELKKVARTGGQVFGSVAADVSDAARMKAAAEDAIEQLGGVDVVIANTGFAECKPIAEADEAHFRKLLDVNYFGHVNTVRPFLPALTAQKSGDIVLVSSILAVMSVYGYGGYSAAKFAIRGFAEALRQEMLLSNVRVKVFLPPTTDTPGLAKENETKPPIVYEMEHGSSFNATHSPEKVANALLKSVPRRRFVGYATFDSWFQYFASRHFPELTLRIADSEMYGAIKRLRKQGKWVG